MNTAALTEERLRSWLDSNQVARERLCLAILALQPGYTDVRSRCPKGGPDGGRDIEALFDGQSRVFGAVGFRNSARDDPADKNWVKQKFKEDLASALKSDQPPTVFVFFTNVDLTPSEYDKLVHKGMQAGLQRVEVFFRERIRILLDGVQGLALRYQYLNVELSSAEQATFFSSFGQQIEELLVREFSTVRHRLDSVDANLRAIQSPLLPCGLLLSVRFDVGERDLERVFGGQIGYRSFGDEKSPPPPLGPAVPSFNGRQHWPGGYADFEDGRVVAACIHRHDVPMYNSFQRKIEHSICIFESENRSKPVSENEPLFSQPVGVKIEVYMEGRPTSEKIAPDLLLSSDSNANGIVIWAGALDETVIVDRLYRSLSVSPPDVLGYSQASLSGAFIRVQLDFFYIHGLNDLAPETQASLHNLQLWVGGEGRRLLAFSRDELAQQRWAENPDVPISGGASASRLLLEIEILPEIFEKNFTSVA